MVCAEFRSSFAKYFKEVIKISFILEYFSRVRFGGAAARFRTSSRRRFQESVDTKANSYVDDLNSKVDKRIRQYRIQVDKKANQ